LTSSTDVTRLANEDTDMIDDSLSAKDKTATRIYNKKWGFLFKKINFDLTSKSRRFDAIQDQIDKISK